MTPDHDHGIGTDGKCPRCEADQAAALDGLATNGPAQAYTMGYEAGRAEALAQQAARADAIAAVSRIFANDSRISHGIDRGDIADWVIDTARQFATWIEHGDEPKACAPIPCPPFEQANLTVDHRFDCSDVDGRIMASCPCGWTTDPVKSVDTAYGLWVDHSDGGRTFDRHVDDAINTVQGNPDLGDRVDQALDAAKMAQPRARPTQT